MRILSADYVVPIAGEPIEKGAVAISGSEIAAVGPRAEIEKTFNLSAEDFGRAAIIPGLVNCHSHLELTTMRGLLDAVESDFPAWLLLLNDTRSRLVSRDIEVAALAGAAEGAAGGVTCFADVGRNARAAMQALTVVGLRGIAFQETPFSPGDATAEKDFAALAKTVADLRPAESELVKVGLSPHSPYTVSGKLFSLIAGLAAGERLPVSIHAAESAAEDTLLRRGTGFFTNVYRKFGIEWSAPRCSPIEFLERTGIIALRPLLAHCVHASQSDVAIMRRGAAAVAHCPKSNAKLGHGVAPLELFLESEIAVGLGSDSVASNNLCDLFEEARFASLVARLRPESKHPIDARRALTLATLGGAAALGMEKTIGSLEAGKQADIAVVSLGGISQMPINDIYSTLVHTTRAADVRRTIVAGREIYRDGRLAGINPDDLMPELETARRRQNR